MTKILYLVTEDWYFCSHRLPLARAAVDSGMEVSVVTRVSEKKEIIEASKIRVIPFEFDRSGTNPILEAIAAWKLFKIFQSEKPDIVHLVALKPVIVGGVAAMLAGVRNRVAAVTGFGFLFTTKDSSTLLRQLIMKLLVFLARHGKVIVQNTDDAIALINYGVANKRMSIIRGAGVDLHYFAFVPEPDGIPVVMLASRLLRDKGVGEFVQAAEILRQKKLRSRFVLVGSPDHDNPNTITENEIKHWMDNGTIEWWGKSDDMAQTLAKSNIFCLPSYKEGLPKVLLEAMAVGRAIITTNAPGCREAIVHGVNGILVPPRDSMALAAAIERLLSNQQLRLEMGIAGRRMAEEHFSQEKVIAETMKIYEELLALD